MNVVSMFRAALVFGFFILTAQSVSALNCSAKVGDPFGGQATEYFLNATNDTCGGAPIGPDPSNDGHIIVGGPTYVLAQFIEDGVGFTPASRSLSCPGSISSNDLGTSLRVFFNEGFSTTCSLSYTDPNGQTVSHSFAAASVLVSGVYVGSTSAFSVSNGWFERVAPTVVLSGLSGTIGAAGQTVTATFSEDVMDFVAADLSLTNVTVSNFQTLTPASYSFDVTPIAAGAVAVQIPATTLTDLPGNDNLASNTLSATVDLITPSVVITGLPSSINGPTNFNATITFSENVTGFVAGDITISGGNIMSLSGSGAVYIASVSATGGTDLVMSIAANVALDAADNGNTASGVVSSANVTATETNALIGQFMLGRANALLANQPDLSRFLRGGAGHFNVEANDDDGIVSFDSGYDAPIWAQLNANWSTNLGAESRYVFAVVGGHSRLSENLLLGAMVQFDVMNETSGAATISGHGWLIGPYFVAKLPDQPLYFEGSLLYGQTRNEISPTGTYTDQFSTERFLATLGVSGEIERENLTLLPFLDVKYTSDAQAAYLDGLGNPIAAQTIGLAQISGGLNFDLALTDSTLLRGGVSGVWSYSSGTVQQPGFEGGRARAALGVTHRIGAHSNLEISGFYDGIGAAGFESYGAELRWGSEF